MKSRIFKEGQIMKLLDLLNVIEDDTPIWIYIDHPFPCKRRGCFSGRCSSLRRTIPSGKATVWC